MVEPFQIEIQMTIKHIYRALLENTKRYSKTICIAAFLVTINQVTKAQSQTDSTIVVVPVSKRVQDNRIDSIPVLFGQRIGADLNVGATGYLQGKVFERSPAGFIFHGITGRVAGLLTRQSSGIPGSDDVALTLRGRTPLVLLDGVPRNITELNPEQISSVTVLKDAISTVMLGQRGMNGAVLITTRKGDGQARDYFNFRVQTQAGVQAPIAKREYLDAFSYATLYNEALANEGRSPLYTQADLSAYQNGTDPFERPNVDWYKQIFRDYAGFSRTNLYADGKSKALSYMVSLDYLDQGGLINELESNSYSTNANYKRYILRSNINLQLNKSLSGYLNLYGRINNTTAPAAGDLTFLTGLLNTTPNNAYPVLNPDGSLGGTLNYDNNIWGRAVYAGYSQNLFREAFFDFGLRQDLKMVAKGLWASGKISFSSLTNVTTNRSKAFDSFNYRTLNGAPLYTRLTQSDVQANSSNVGVSEQTSYIEFLTGYDRRWGKNGINAKATANMDNYKVFVNNNLPTLVSNFAASVKYDWDQKYILEAAAAYSGLNYYRKGERFGFFPAVGLGWNLHSEDFLNKSGFVDQLKLRASYGLTGANNQGNFNYIQRYNAGSNYAFGPTAAAATGLVEGPVPYGNTWSESLKANIGLDGSFMDDRLWLSLDLFRHDQQRLPITTGNNSGVLGSTYPILYIGENDISGLEASIGFAGKRSGKFGYAVAANFSTSRTKTTFNDEQIGAFPSLQRNGFFTNQMFGYLADGFVSQAGQGPVLTGYTSQPGDLKYRDLNGDNTIDFRDVTAIGSARPQVNYGLSTQLFFGNLSFSFLIQGVANTNVMLSGNTVFPFLDAGNGGATQAFPANLDRWTPQTANTASFPRLSIGNNPNNYAASSYWIRNTGFVRLKNAEVGYTFSSKLLTKAKIKNIRLFANGLNLFTFSGFEVFDPEMPFADYAIQKVFNGGLSVTF
jgi:TonB-linked SusC/RagA family outer membrane protein